jgi:hypothetical protein
MLNFLRDDLIRKTSGRKRFSVTQSEKLRNDFREYEKEVITIANNAWPVLETRLGICEEILKNLNGMHFIGDPENKTQEEIIEEAQLLDVSEMIETLEKERENRKEEIEKTKEKSKD